MKLSEVKRFYDLGFSVIYIREKEKRPVESKWTTGVRKTWEELENSFESKYNLGVRLGGTSKIAGGYLCVIDVDIKKPTAKKAALAKLKEITGMVLYPTVMSGSGGGSRHLYCVSEKPFKMITIAKQDDWEICAYSEGRQVVLPGSTHPSGMKYAWANGLSIFERGLPMFHPEEYETVTKAVAHNDERILDFKAVDVQLFDFDLPQYLIEQIKTGKDVQDRSATLFSAALMMCRAGMNDNEILSVLSDEKNWISGAGYEHTQSRSRARAVAWLHKYTLTKARYETNIMRRFENKPVRAPFMSAGEAVEVATELQEDADDSFPDLSGKPIKPKTTQRNIIHALEKKLGGQVVGLDEFANRVVFLKDTPYGGVKGREITDNNDLQLKEFLAKHYGFEPSRELCYEAHTLIALKNKFHPVRNYIDTLTWDEIPRLDAWLERGMGAVGPVEYLRAIARKTLVAAIQRVYSPGEKFDQILVLEGLQGKGKSTAISILAGDKWFTDSLGDIQSKDVVDQMTGKWIIELGELAALKSKEVESIKTFAARKTDRVRLPYGKRPADYPRQSIFIGSTNDDEYLMDKTGNRRFWPVKITEADFDWLKSNRDQLWAEAKVRYDLGEDVFLNKEMEKIAKLEQKKRLVSDEWEVKVQAFLNNPTNERFTATHIFQSFEGNIGCDPTQHESTRIGKIMLGLGYSRKSIKVGGIPTKGWSNDGK